MLTVIIYILALALIKYILFPSKSPVQRAKNAREKFEDIKGAITRTRVVWMLDNFSGPDVTIFRREYKGTISNKQLNIYCAELQTMIANKRAELNSNKDTVTQ